MKFLAIGRAKDIYYMLPPEKFAEVWEAGVAIVEKYRKSGKCLDIYEMADFQGSVSIWEVNSSEEATRIMLENPQAPFTNFEIYPLVEWDVALKGLMEWRKKQKKSGK